MIYLFDGVDLYATYGIKVMKVFGVHDFLKRKGETGHNWLDEDGEEHYTDVSDIYFEPRDIVLECYIRATSTTTLLTNFNAFKAVVESSGLHTLKLPYDSKTYSVYVKDGGNFSMITPWASNIYVGKFTLILREPVPARAT